MTTNAKRLRFLALLGMSTNAGRLRFLPTSLALLWARAVLGMARLVAVRNQQLEASSRSPRPAAAVRAVSGRVPIARYLTTLACPLLIACRGQSVTPARDTTTTFRPGTPVASAVPDWRRGATCYEVFVRSFYDSNGDGIGDLRGLTEKLDYINDGNPTTRSDLGARCVWLMPVNESSSYHGYDATNYYRVEPDYGTNDDFKRVRRRSASSRDRRARRHGAESPVQRASVLQGSVRRPGAPRIAPGSVGRRRSRPSSDRGGRRCGTARRVRNEYYYGVFWEGMPDLNYETPAVRDEAKKIAAFWLTQMGVDGFRLDAVPYLVEEGTRQIGTAGTHAFLREYATAVRSVAPEAFTVGEVWDGIDLMLPYYPDQLESYFAFDLVRRFDRRREDGLGRRRSRAICALPEGSAERPLVVVSAESRPDANLTALGGDVARAKLAATLLLTLPGLPFVYYGEEIGMTGDKPDERLRTPMQWTGGANAGFTRGTPWETLAADWSTTNVAAQDGDDGSLLTLYRKLIHLRVENPALGSGDFVALGASNRWRRGISASQRVSRRARRRESGRHIALERRALLVGKRSRGGRVLRDVPPGRRSITDHDRWRGRSRRQLRSVRDASGAAQLHGRTDQDFVSPGD